jgi:hypothetical protein
MSRWITIGAYLSCLALAVLLEVHARRRASRITPLGDVLSDVLADRPVRITLVAFWWWIGWHFLVGQTVDPPWGR